MTDRFADKIIRCRCGAIIGKTAFDSQVLILESGLVLFNYACFMHSCGSYGNFLAPELPEDDLSNLEKFPDTQTIERRAVKIRSNFRKSLPESGFTGVKRSRKKFTARININGKTRYLGSFPTAELAHAAYLRAKTNLQTQ